LLSFASDLQNKKKGTQDNAVKFFSFQKPSATCMQSKLVCDFAQAILFCHMSFFANQR